MKGSGRGYRLTGHHEMLVPLLAAALVEKDGRAAEAAREEPGQPRRAGHPRPRPGAERGSAGRACCGSSAATSASRSRSRTAASSSPPPPTPITASARCSCGGARSRCGRWRTRAARPDPGQALRHRPRGDGLPRDPKELVRGVVDQTRDIILHAFQLDLGGLPPQAGAAPGEAITLNMRRPSSSSTGSRRSRRGAASSRERGASGRATCRSPGSEGLFKQLTLDVDQAALLRSVKASRDVESLLRASPC